MRAIKPRVTVVAGGYDPSLASEAYEPRSTGIDYVVRGEGELTFRALLQALSEKRGVQDIPGLCFRSSDGAAFSRTPERPVSRLEGSELALPDRGSRVLPGMWEARPDDVRRLEIDGGPRRLAFERRPGNRWQMVEPIDVEADPSIVENLAANLKLLEKVPAEVLILRPDPEDHRKLTAEGVKGHF